MWIEDDIYRGATSVRAKCLLSLFGYENTNWYPILLTVEFRVTLLSFKLPLVSPFQRRIRTGLHHTRLSITKHIRVLLLLNNLDYLILLSEYKKGFSSKKDEKPVVPPSLAEWSAHFTDIKTRMFEYLSLVTMRRSPKPTTLKGSVWGSEVHSLFYPHWFAPTISSLKCLRKDTTLRHSHTLYL